MYWLTKEQLSLLVKKLAEEYKIFGPRHDRVSGEVILIICLTGPSWICKRLFLITHPNLFFSLTMKKSLNIATSQRPKKSELNRSISSNRRV